MTDKEILQRYVDFIPFLSEVLGPGCEIVIHDVTNPRKSLIAIQNPLSGREIGSPITDLAENIVAEGKYRELDYLANYDGRAKNMDFLSSTYFIKNQGRLIGLLCINKDISAVNEFTENVVTFLKHYNIFLGTPGIYSENLDSNVEDYLQTKISQTISASGIPAERMSPKEKTAVVHRLKEAGILSLKGSVAKTAELLSVSVPTIYRYMK